MTINQRIKIFRKSLHLSQEEFGKRIGLKKSAASWIEKEGSTITDANIRLICTTFGVSERWLREGTGDMLAQTRDDYVRAFAERCHLGETFIQVMKNFLALSEEDRATMFRLIQQVAAGLPAPALSKEDEIEREVERYRQELLAEQKGSSSTSTPSDGTNGSKESQA
ncbi:helix-turn-helix domain-containing protein [uncultured Selenomonas sp.]|uniref:helix-turn-helix domain-containing protein n=1 Tax=uncultured Selenomonas sp. TaxID=159275 RepID=UPI0025E2AEF3|nr:helix-turn-helix transcriptional regulator [uncultured Selenomonas sp.]